MSDTRDPLRHLRPEVLRRPADDGGVELLDLLFERFHRLSPREVRGLRRDDPIVMMRLERDGLLDGPTADRMRQAVWDARADAIPREPVSASVPDLDWGRAASLPAIVTAAWRDPERWRRLAEDRAAGQAYLVLRGLVADDAVDRLLTAVEALPFEPLDTDVVRGHRHLLGPGEVAEWRAFMADETVRYLFGGLLGRAVPAGATINCWRLDDGDFMAVHPDGRRYHGTLSLGLNRGWTAGCGGAIAFGEPTPDGFVTRHRWLPHAGDVGVFAPDVDTWHVVEPVAGRRRYTLTGWWVEERHAL